MLDLTDAKWKEFEGGYRAPYDASVPLRKFERTSDEVVITSIIDELWEELHHQGDVGLASYMSVPHLIRIAKEKQLFDPSLIALISTIEIQRNKNNPILPEEYLQDYLISLKGLSELALLGMNKEWDIESATAILGAIAVSKGQTNLGNALLIIDSEDMIDEFVKGY